jgi:hypothetical protein
MFAASSDGRKSVSPSRDAQLGTQCKRARLSQIFQLLEAAVLYAGFENSIGGCQVDRGA